MKIITAIEFLEVYGGTAPYVGPITMDVELGTAIIAPGCSLRCLPDGHFILSALPAGNSENSRCVISGQLERRCPITVSMPDYNGFYQYTVTLKRKGTDKIHVEISAPPVG